MTKVTKLSVQYVEKRWWWIRLKSIGIAEETIFLTTKKAMNFMGFLCMANYHCDQNLKTLKNTSLVKMKNWSKSLVVRRWKVVLRRRSIYSTNFLLIEMNSLITKVSQIKIIMRENLLKKECAYHKMIYQKDFWSKWRDNKINNNRSKRNNNQ